MHSFESIFDNIVENFEIGDNDLEYIENELSKIVEPELKEEILRIMSPLVNMRLKFNVRFYLFEINAFIFGMFDKTVNLDAAIAQSAFIQLWTAYENFRFAHTQNEKEFDVSEAT